MSFIEGIRDTFLYPAPAGPPPAAGYLTRIVIPCILIVLNLALQHNDSIGWDLVTFLARSQFFMVWLHLTKDTRFGTIWKIF